MTPRRVTVVAHELRGFAPSGGMGTATTLLALALARTGNSVEILLGINAPEAMDPHWAGVYARAGVRIRAAPPPDERVEPWQFMHARSIELGLRDDPPDVVVAPDFGAPVYTALRLRQAGAAFEDTLFVVFCHGPWRYALDLSPRLGPPDLRNVLAFGIHEQASVELADVAVSPSAFLLGWMRDAGWTLPERTLVVPYFTQATATGEPAPRAQAREGDPLRRLVFFGRVDERKGLKVFAAGLNALEPGLLEGLELEFVGKTTATWPRDRVESLFDDATRRALRAITFAGDLDQHEALARIGRPRTLVVTPSLQENSPNAVYECLERGIPFIASDVGGVPELIAPEDRDRILFPPTTEGVAAALRRVLVGRTLPRPPSPAFESEASLARWGELVALRPREPRRAARGAVDVVVRRGRPGETVSQAVAARSAPYVLILDEDDVPDPELVERLVDAGSTSGADVVTCAVRLDDGRLHFFSGEPRGLGVLSNGYGTVALFRREVLADQPPAQGESSWALLGRLSASGARIVSLPLPLVAAAAPGTIDENPSDALVVARELERALPHPARALARLATGLAANAGTAAADPSESPVRRAIRRLSRAARRGPL